MAKTVAAIALAYFLATAASAQTAPQGFDVISIKPTDPSFNGSRMGLSPAGDFQAQGATIQSLIQNAYDVRPFQISGGPGWMQTDRFDIITKSEGGGFSEAQLMKMTEAERDAYKDKLLGKVRQMLADRFQLRIHREMKDFPVYALVLTKSGSKLEPAKDNGKIGGGISIQRDATGKTVMTVTNSPVASLVKQLSNQVGRTVLDQTGLKGNFDYKMTWAPDLNQRPPDVAGNEPAPLGNDGPSIFTAVQDQLGLKLDSQKGPVEVIVIDSVQKPSAN